MKYNIISTCQLSIYLEILYLKGVPVVYMRFNHTARIRYNYNEIIRFDIVGTPYIVGSNERFGGNIVA